MAHPKPLVIAATWIDEHPYSPDTKLLESMCDDVGAVANCTTLKCIDCPLFNISNFRDFKRKHLDRRLNEDSPVAGDELQGDPREIPADAQFPKDWHLSGWN